jgi:hypothetical protein
MGDERLERAGAQAASVSADWVTDVAREVTRALAPQELAVFGAVADRWASGGAQRGRRRMPWAAVGFGVDAVLLGELVVPVLTGAIGEVLGNFTWEHRPRRRSPQGRGGREPRCRSRTAGPGHRAAAGRPA